MITMYDKDLSPPFPTFTLHQDLLLLLWRRPRASYALLGMGDGLPS